MCKSLWSEDGNSSQVGVMLGEETLDLPTCPQAGRPLARRWLAPLISLAYLHNACWVLVGELEGFCWIKDRFEDFLGCFPHAWGTAPSQIPVLSASSFGQDLVLLIYYHFFPLVKPLLTYLPHDTDP